jgi:formamidopyrimidine-DNA glycosylase
LPLIGAETASTFNRKKGRTGESSPGSHMTTGANLFQSAIMGKTLLLSVQTNRTLRVHEGIAGTFAYQEQMCALENLRIWKDQDSNGVLAMIHYTPQFRDGYMTFYCETACARGKRPAF